MKVRVEVTENDILNGCQSSGWLCPVALALARVLRNDNIKIFVEPPQVILISKETVRINIEQPNRWKAALTDEITEWINRFDQSIYSVDPITFEIDLPEMAG